MRTQIMCFMQAIVKQYPEKFLKSRSPNTVFNRHRCCPQYSGDVVLNILIICKANKSL